MNNWKTKNFPKFPNLFVDVQEKKEKRRNILT